MKSAVPSRFVSGLARAGLLSLVAGCGLMWAQFAFGVAQSINPGTDPGGDDPCDCTDVGDIVDTCVPACCEAAPPPPPGGGTGTDTVCAGGCPSDRNPIVGITDPGFGSVMPTLSLIHI